MKVFIFFALVALLPGSALAEVPRSYGELPSEVETERSGLQANPDAELATGRPENEAAARKLVDAVEPSPRSGANSPTGLQDPSSSSGFELLVEKVFQQKFFRALTRARSGDLTGAGQLFDDLALLALEQGYANLTQYSIEMIRAAQTAEEAGDRAQAKLLLEKATLLSPAHPRVHLLAVSFWKILGVGRALDHLRIAAHNLWSYPTIGWTLVLNTLLLTMVGLILALSIVCVVQLLRSGEQVILELGRRFSRHSRGILAPLTLAVTVIAPLYFGIFGALAAWSVLLGLSNRSCRSLALVTGCVFVTWAYAMPFLIETGIGMKDHLNTVYEEVNAGNYVPANEDYLLNELEARPSDPYTLFAVALSLHRKGLAFEAQGVYQKVTEVVQEESAPLHGASVLNLGVINLQDGRFKDGRGLFELLERRQFKSFELYYNLALIHLALLDTVQHRHYYELAKRYDFSRLDRLVVAGVEEAQPLVGAPPTAVYAKRLFEGRNSLSSSQRTIVQQRVNELSQASLRNGTPWMILGLGIVLILAGGILIYSWRKPQRKRPTMTFDMISPMEGPVSRLWAVMPGGMFVAGERPVLGLCIITVFFVMVLAAFDAPMRLYSVLPVNVDYQGLLFGLAGLVLALSALLGVIVGPPAPEAE